MKKLLFLLFVSLTLCGHSTAAEQIKSGDGLKLMFSGNNNPTISDVSIGDTSISGAQGNKGGFRVMFEKENYATLYDELVVNGNLTDNSTGWRLKNGAEFRATDGRDGKGAICLSAGQQARQIYTFPEGEGKVTG